MKPHGVDVELQRDGRVFVLTYSMTEDHLEILDGLPAVLPSMDDPGLGAVVVAALHRSNARTLPARDLRADPPDREFLEWLGLPNYGAYMKGVRSVGLYAQFDDSIGTVYVTPEHNGGRKGGFTPISEEEITVEYQGPAQLADVVRAAMAKATL